MSKVRARKPTQAASGVSLDATFFRELLRFYRENRGAVRSHYRLLTKTILDYNEPGKFRAKKFLRQPQYEALEMYVFLKEYCKLRPVHEAFADWYNRRNGFERRSDLLDAGGMGVLSEELVFNETAYAAVFQKMRAAGQIYPNYIFALTMGVGKTLLMATCIFYEFVLAEKFPDDPLYCHNALIFAPDRTVLQSLREIESFDFSKVLPPECANRLQANINLHYLDEAGVTLNVLNNSKYNLIISNTQKIILKRKAAVPSAAEELFMAGTPEYSGTKDIYDDIADLYGSAGPETERELAVNQRFLKLRGLKQLGIYVDEAHHAFGDKLGQDMRDVKKETSLRFTINTLAQGLKNQGGKMVACFNYTGTPYVKNEVLPEVVYAYSLNDAILNGYLKMLRLHKYSNTRDKEFVRAVVEHFWNKFGERRLEGMLPKLAFFSPDIRDANEKLRPLLEEVLREQHIPTSRILINVGDESITSNDDIKDFNRLDAPQSNKQFIILVNKGKEGWNCRSLCGVAMFRKPKSKVFVLQASMRCLRAVGEKQEEGQVYLSEENIGILNDELQQNFRLNTDEIQKLKSEKTAYEVRVLKKKSLRLTQVRHMYRRQDKILRDPVVFNADAWDVEQYKLVHTEEKSTLRPGRKSGPDFSEDITRLKERRAWTPYTLTAEVARYLCESPLKIEKILVESKEGMKTIVELVNQYNELLYDKIIPLLFATLYDITSFEQKEEQEVELVKTPESGFYRILGDPAKTQLFDDWMKEKSAYAEKSFHLDTYCFDSSSEQEFFTNVIAQTEVKEIYFTGMLTHGQSDFHINYIDPETHSVRSYYPDFLILTKNNEWLVVEVKANIDIDDPVVQAKKFFAENILKENRIQYRMIPHSCAASANITQESQPARQDGIFK
jgi:hypothetical protein